MEGPLPGEPEAASARTAEPLRPWTGVVQGLLELLLHQVVTRTSNLVDQAAGLRSRRIDVCFTVISGFTA